MHWRLACLLLAAGLELLPGCGTAPEAGQTKHEASSLLAWPSPPGAARVRYLRSIVTAQDWGIKKSFLQRFADLLSGGGDAHFIRPAGVAEWQGVLYVADPGAQALWILDAGQGRMVKVQQVGEDRLLSPVSVAVRPDGSVYAADSALKAVFLFDRSGQLLRVAAKRGLERPAGLAFDALRKRLYIADALRQQILVLDEEAGELHSFGQAGKGDGELNRPTHVAVDAAGDVLVTDALNFRVQSFDPQGRFVGKFGHHGDGSGDISSPKGVAVDSAGNVFLVDALFDAVQIFARDGRYLLGFGERGAQPGQFWLPGGLFINPRNEIYVADSYNQRVQVFVGVPQPVQGDRP